MTGTHAGHFRIQILIKSPDSLKNKTAAPLPGQHEITYK